MQTVQYHASIRFDAILTRVAVYYDVPIADLLGRHRAYRIAHARQICMYLARLLTKLSFAEIGEKLGGRDHTTVHHGIGAARKRIAASEEVSGQVYWLERNVREAAAIEMKAMEVTA
jgi:chromosomal replication initiator protein